MAVALSAGLPFRPSPRTTSRIFPFMRCIEGEGTTVLIRGLVDANLSMAAGVCVCVYVYVYACNSWLGGCEAEHGFWYCMVVCVYVCIYMGV